MNAARRCPEGKKKKKKRSVFSGEGVDEPDYRVLLLGVVSFPNDTFNKTVQESAHAGAGIELLLFSLGV